MNALSQVTIVALAAAALSGCATQHSRIDGYRYYRAPIDTYDVIITKIDGRSTSLTTPVQVEPGPHVVAVQTYQSRSEPYRDERTIQLDVKPCTHYYLAAVKPNRLSRDFDVKVDYEQPVPGCTPPAGR